MSQSVEHDHQRLGRARVRTKWLPWLVLGLGLALVLTLVLAVPAWLQAATHQEATRLTAGRSHNCVLGPSGGVSCWGANDHGQLGDATTVARSKPVMVAGLAGTTSVVAGGDHTCAVTNLRTVVCWGRNDHGQLGDGTTTSSSVPVQVTGLASVAGLALGRSHSCALLADGSARCWGGNGVGQLGDGSTTDSATPVDVMDLPIAMAAVASQADFTCAVTVRGRLRCWGDNSDGQLGTRGTAPTLLAVPAVGVDPRVSRVAAGDTHACAVDLRGAVLCWGANGAGQLGNGSTASSLAAVGVPGLESRVASLSAADGRTCAVREGAVLCWGRALGDPGDGATNPLPVELVPSGALAVALGATHACALTDAGGVKCWGGNQAGQLGDGTAVDSATPVDVVGL